MTTNNRKLPLLETVNLAYTVSWDHRWEYLKIIRCWLPLFALLTFLYTWAIWPHMQPLLCLFQQMKLGGQSDVLNKAVLWMMPLALIRLAVSASIAVAWHRLILLGEKTTSSCYMRFDRVVFNYFLIGLIFYVFSLLNTAANIYHAPFIISMPLVIIVLLIEVRLFILLPIKAIGKQTTILDAWKSTGWNFWRIASGLLLCFLPSIIIYFLIKTPCTNSTADAVVFTLKTVLALALVLPVTLTFLSLCYRHFIENWSA